MDFLRKSLVIVDFSIKWRVASVNRERERKIESGKLRKEEHNGISLSISFSLLFPLSSRYLSLLFFSSRESHVSSRGTFSPSTRLYRVSLPSNREEYIAGSGFLINYN